MAGIYNPVDFGRQDTRRVQQQEYNVASPNANTPVVVGDEKKILASIANEFAGRSAQVANKAFDIQIQNEYLEGAAAAAAGESEESLQSNPLTKDWKTAGFRDTAAKFGMADAEAQMAYDMTQGQKLREKDPEAMRQYLNVRRKKLLPTLQGMSGEQRSQAMVRLGMSDRAAMSQHRSEHTAFIVDTKLQAVGATVNTNLSLLNTFRAKVASGKLDVKDYNEKLSSASVAIASDVWGDESLPYEVRQKLTAHVLEQTLASDNPELYDYFDSFEFPDDRLGKATMTQRLSPEDQVKMAGKYRESMSRTEALRTMAYNKQMSKMRSDIKNDIYTGTYAELEAVADAGVANKSLTGSEYSTILKEGRDWESRAQTNGLLSQALSTGDYQAIRDSGKTEADAVAAMHKTLRGADPAVKLRTWLDVGQKGTAAGYKEAGTMIGYALSQMAQKDSPMLPQHVQTLDTAMAELDKAQASGEYNTRVGLLSGVGDDNRLRLERIIAMHEDGKPIDAALTEVLQREAAEASVTPTARAASATKTRNTVYGLADDLNAIGFWRGVGLHVSQIWNSQDAARLQVAPTSNMDSTDGWFSDSETVKYYESVLRREVKSEADHVMLTGYQDTDKAIMNTAMAGVASRTIKTDQGPLFLPRGTDIGKVFGVGPGNQAAIGEALNQVMKDNSKGKANSRYRLAFAQGNVSYQEYDKNGQVIGTGKIDPASVRAAIGHVQDNKDKRNNDVYGSGALAVMGSGTSVPGTAEAKGDNISFTYNGKNTAAVQDEWVFDFRKNLVEHEAVRATPYKDASGKVVNDKAVMTAGVGVSSHNPFYPKVGEDGKVSVDDIKSSFLAASDSAAKAGRITSEQVGLKNKAWFMLFSELSYQSGNAFLTQENATGNVYRNFVSQAQAGNKAEAVEAFKKTRAWYESRDRKNPEKETKRQRSYINLINEAMKGQ